MRELIARIMPVDGKFRPKLWTFKGLYQENPILIDFDKMIVVSLLTILLKILIFFFNKVELKNKLLRSKFER